MTNEKSPGATGNRAGDDGASVSLQLDHGSLCVGDIGEAVHFYGEVLGLEPLPRPDFGFEGAWFRAGATPIHLTTGGSIRGPDAPLRPNEGHLALRVDDGLDTLLERLDHSGAPIYELPNSPAAQRQIFVLDPWGNMLEFCTYDQDGPTSVEASSE